jgi:hypothetical protein
VTVKPTVVVCLRPPLVPVMVSVYALVDVDLFVFTLRIELPEGDTEVGLNVAVVPAGRPLTLKVTVPLNPPDAAADTV